MARLPRFIVPNQPQHVIQRGNNKQPIFITAQDYLYYKDKLLLAAAKHECKIHAYVLMTNHVHLLISPLKEDSLSRMMQMLGRYYVQYFNHHYQRTGTLWEGRYKATLISTERYLFTCMRYIELNPLRANMVTDLAQYRWSSYHYNALGNTDLLITPHDDYIRLAKTLDECQKCYLNMFNDVINKETLHEIREATNKSWVLGSNKFKEELANLLQKRVTPTLRGGDRKSKKYKMDSGLA